MPAKRDATLVRPPRKMPTPESISYPLRPFSASETELRRVGLVLYALGVTVGALLLALVFLVLPVATGAAVAQLKAMLLGAALAFPAALVYLIVPRLLDRFDPEPTYALVMALGWGAVAASGMSALFNLTVELAIGGFWGEVVTAVAAAPLVEEATKGVFILGCYWFLRRDFDGVVDGIIYATFVAIGFAAVENVIYYARAGLEAGSGGIAMTFLLRGILTPWGHPLYTSMTGLGLGISRESSSPVAKALCPVAGFTAAVLLHALWNGSAMMLGRTPQGAVVFLLLLPLWFVFVAAFGLLLLTLVFRRGRIIRRFLEDEVVLGHLTQRELDLVTQPFAGLLAYRARGRPGVEFVRAVARLALSKWHIARAVQGQHRTMSVDFVLPLRARIRALRSEGASPG